MNRMKMAKGERHSAAPTLHHIEVKKAENGGHVITHVFDSGGEHTPPGEHVFSADEGHEALQHIAEAADIKINSPEASSEGEESERGAGEYEEAVNG